MPLTYTFDKYGQQMQPFLLKLQKNMPFSLASIDDWLVSVLGIEVIPSVHDIPDDTSKQYEHTIAFMWRVLLLSRSLLQAIRIPVFDPGRILSISSHHEKQHSIRVAIVKIEHVPQNIYFKSIDMAYKIILSLSKHSLTDTSIQNLFQVIQKRFIKPHYHLSGSGKSTMPILSEAYMHHIPFGHLGNGVYQLGWGSNAKLINRSATELDSTIGSMMAQKKMVTSQLAREAGLPAPVHKMVKTKKGALLAAKEIGWPVVVKPADMDRGEGVNVDIANNTELIDAFEFAKKVSKVKQVIIERQVGGVCCRIFIANDKMLYGVKRLPKSVIGDGNHSVKELVDKANHMEMMAPPWKKSEQYPMDEMAIKAMNVAGFTLSSIPKADELVPLRKIESTQWGGYDEDIMEHIHPDNLDLSLRAAKLFGLNVAGVDIITPDISVPWHQNGAIVNEVNYSPQYGGGEISKRSIPAYLHDLVKDDGRIPVTVVLGDIEAMEYAKKLQEEQTAKELRCFISSHDTSFSSSNDEVHFTFKSLYDRTKALLMDKRVDALIMVVQNDEFLKRGLPVDKIDKIIETSKKLCKYEQVDIALSNREYQEVILQLQRVNKPA